VLGSAINVRTAVVVGGMDMMEQALELKNRPHIVVATPGRLVDLMDSGSGEWSLSKVKFLVCIVILDITVVSILIERRYWMRQIDS
jgi:ATP-dependent RNA helicase DDX49/DBP8